MVWKIDLIVVNQELDGIRVDGNVGGKLPRTMPFARTPRAVDSNVPPCLPLIFLIN